MLAKQKIVVNLKRWLALITFENSSPPKHTYLMIILLNISVNAVNTAGLSLLTQAELLYVLKMKTNI